MRGGTERGAFCRREGGGRGEGRGGGGGGREKRPACVAGECVEDRRGGRHEHVVVQSTLDVCVYVVQSL